MTKEIQQASFAALPDEMKQALRWVCWTEDKTPIDVHTARGASITDPGTWATFEAACAFIGSPATYTDRTGARMTAIVQGIGFVLGDGWCGIDLDGGAAHGGKAVPSSVLDDFLALQTYGEVSRSGEGYHFIGRYHGDRLEGTRHGCVEIYTGSRYFIVTGRVHGSPCPVRDLTPSLPVLHERYIAAHKRPQPSASPVPVLAYDDRLDEVLRLFDPVPMGEWSFVGICLKSMGAPLDVFDEWSMGAGERYGGRRQIERWWQFWTEPDPDAAQKLYGAARRRGWRSAPQVHDHKAQPVENAPRQAPMLPEEEQGDADSMGAYMSELLRALDGHSVAPSIPTGFENLDAQCGGLYPGLYVLGAISSLGKTTFMHAMADQMAEAGHTVLYFSLEQSRMELALKSLSRMTARMDPTFCEAVTAMTFRRGEQRALLQRAAQAYTTAVGNRLHVIDGGLGTTADTIVRYVERFMAAHPGGRPVVIVDYLQLLRRASDEHVPERENIDQCVQTLKRLQLAHQLVVIAISSVNRGNYLLPIDFESFKESGGIEYSADVVWGLQLQVVTDSLLFDDDKKTKQKRDLIRQAKKESPRKLELVCLKNRWGVSNYYAGFRYFPAYDYFEPDEAYMEPDRRSTVPNAVKRR